MEMSNSDDDNPRERPDAAVALIRKYGSSSKSSSRVRTLQRLAALSDPAAISLFVDVMSSEGSDVERLAAANGLGRQKSDEGRIALVTTALGDSNQAVRREAIDSLTNYDLPQSELDQLISACLGGTTADKAGLAKLLATDSSPSGGEVLRQLLADPKLDVRVAAFHSLCSRGDPSMIPSLRDSLKKENWLVRRAMRRGLDGAFDAISDA